MSDLLPFWAPWSGRAAVLLVFLVGIGLALMFLRRPRLRRASCPWCGYDLSATLDGAACQECGRTSATRDRLLGRRRVRLAVVALLMALVLPGFVAQQRIRRYGWDYYLRLHPLYDMFPRKTLQATRPAGYSVSLSRDRRGNNVPALRVKLSGRGEPVWFEDHFAGYVTPVTDLNGDGIPDAIVRTHSGGAHCCSTYRIVSLERSGPRVLLEYAAGNGGLKPVDVDGDGIAELMTGDDVWAYWNTSYAGSPRPDVILAWDGTTWSFSGVLNRRRPPPPLELDNVEARLKPLLNAGLWGGSELWMQMLELIYHGNADRAYELLVNVWPEKTRWEGVSRHQFWADFRRQLAKSTFADAIYAMNAGQVDLRPPVAEKAAGQGANPP
jgi:hypothetical protein